MFKSFIPKDWEQMLKNVTMTGQIGDHIFVMVSVQIYVILLGRFTCMDMIAEKVDSGQIRD